MGADVTSHPRLRLRVRIARVPHATDDCLVRRAIVERLTPWGQWRRVGDDEDPIAAHEADVEARRLAAEWADRPEYGYPMYTRSRGYVWCEPLVEGDRVTPIPAGRS